MAGHTTRVSMVIVAAVLAACTSDVIVDLNEIPFAQAIASCGPADGPTVEVFLSATAFDNPPAAPYLRLVFPASLSQLKAQRFPVDGKYDAAYALKVEGGSNAIATATSGALTVNAVRADSTIDGAIDVRFTDGTRVRQSFLAAWRGRRILCG
jgi:hypothetical protein